MKRLLFGLAVLAAVCGVATAVECPQACPTGTVCTAVPGVTNGMCLPPGALDGISGSGSGVISGSGSGTISGSGSISGSTSGSTSGSIPSFDFDTDDCSPKCASGKSCWFGKCVDSTTFTSGCPATCDIMKMQMCLFGSCMDVSKNGQAGYLAGPCVSGKCSGAGLTCMESICIPSGALDLIPKCKTNAQCGGTMRCDVATGACVEFEAPALNCSGKCASSESCYYGNCIPKLTERTCTPACKAEWGQVCHPLLGICVGNSTSSNACGDCGNGGECLPGAPFLGLGPTCVGSTCSFGSANSMCGNGSYCRQTGLSGARCQTCDGACSDLRRNLGGDVEADAFLTMLAAVGVSSATNIKGSAATAAMVSAGVLQLTPDTVMDIDASVQVQTLLLSAATAAAARVSANMRVDSVQVTTANNRLLLNDNAQLVARQLEVKQGGVLTLAMPYTGPAVFNLSQVVINGQLNIVGGRTQSVLNFPSTAANAQASASGLVQLGVDARVIVTGFAGSANWALSDGAEVHSSASTPLVLSGDVYGSEGELNLNGVATLSGRTVEPRIYLNADSTLRVDTTQGSGAQRLGDLRFATSDSEASTVEISGTAKSGGDLYFSYVQSCPPEATIRYQVQGNARVAVNAGMTLFNYGAKTWGRFAHDGSTETNFSCRIKVCGTDGGCVNIKNPLDARANAGSSSSAARRLLADEVELTASWEPTRLSVSGNGEGSNGGNAAAGLAAQPLLLLALVFAAMIAMMRM